MKHYLAACVLLALLVAVASLGAVDPPMEAPAKEPMDLAIERGLEFLHKRQERDGAWLDADQKNPAITSLAVMAYLSAGHVPGEGKYSKTVEKGIRWVMDQQQENGLIATVGRHEMYHHGISTLMLAEAAGMTDAPLGAELRKKLEKAIEVVLKAQRMENNDDRGGWRYTIEPTRRDSNADMSVTGWQVMALRAAKNLGCDVPAERIDRAVEYILRCKSPYTKAFRYTSRGSEITIPCTGTAILCLELCGKNMHRCKDSLEAGSYLLSKPPRWGSDHFFYGIYYSSQAMFQLGQQEWKEFRPKLHQVLLGNQKSTGSWQGEDEGSKRYGASYSTSMAILALTVEYRFLPIYQRDEEMKEK